MSRSTHGSTVKFEIKEVPHPIYPDLYPSYVAICWEHPHGRSMVNIDYAAETLLNYSKYDGLSNLDVITAVQMVRDYLKTNPTNKSQRKGHGRRLDHVLYTKRRKSVDKAKKS